MHPRSSVRWALALCALAACDLRNPASPSVASIPTPTGGEAKHAESALVGSYVAPTSVPEPGQRTSYIELERTGIPLAPNTYTLLRVTGTLKVLGNPYKPSSVPGEILFSYTPVESGQSTGRGHTNVWLHRIGAAPPPGGAEKVSYYFRPDAAGRDEILLVRTGQEPFEVWSEREMMPGASRAFGYCMPGFPYCDSEHVVQPDSSVLKNYIWIEDFWVAESHMVTATRITEPLIVDGPAAVAPGGIASFSARPFEGLRLRDRNGSPADVRWLWYPKDTTGTPALNIDPKFVCSGQQPAGTCRFEPKESGRLHVYSFVEGALVETNKIVRVQQMELKCNGAQDSVRITRADELNCEVSGATDITGWEFRADSSGYQNPAAGGTPIKGIEWKGRVVLSGTVTVNARVAGAPESKSVQVRVSARNWTGLQIPRVAAEEPAPVGELPAKPDTVRQLGHIHPVLSVELSVQKNWTPILSGPNANLAYLHDLPISFHGIIHVNRVALAVGSDFWNAQLTRQPRNATVVHCLRREADVTGFIPEILRHEGVGFDPKSHAFLFVEEAERVGNPQFERVVGASAQELANDASRITQVVGGAADIASARADSTGFRPSWCKFKYTY